MMHLRPRRISTALAALVMLLAAALPGLVMAPGASAADEGLRAYVLPGIAKPGAHIKVTGTGWPANGRIQLTTCGNLGRGGSPSCDVPRTYTTIANADGAFETQAIMGRPPVPCPCVMHIVEADTYQAVDIPITVVGHHTADPPPPAVGNSTAPPIQVVSTNLSGWGPFLSLFGAGPERTLALTVRNTTKQPIDTARLTLVDATTADGQAVTTIGPLAPNEIKTFDIPVTLSAGVGGPRSLTGSIDGGPQFVAETTSYAWGFYALDVILLLLLIWVVVRRLRAREPAAPRVGRHSSGPAHAATEASEPAETDDADSPVPFPQR